MNITEIPFNRFLGLKHSTLPGYILEVDASPDHVNHLDTVHAGVQFALAEATSGEFLLRTFPEHADAIIPVVRRAEVKYRKPASGKLYSTAMIDEADCEKLLRNLKAKGRGLIAVNVEVLDSEGTVTMSSSSSR